MIIKYARISVLTAVFVLSHNYSIKAATLYTLKPEKICENGSRGGPVKRDEILSFLLTGVSWTAIDKDGSGLPPSREEMWEAVTNPEFCSDPRRINKCETSDAEKLNRAADDLDIWINDPNNTKVKFGSYKKSKNIDPYLFISNQKDKVTAICNPVEEPTRIAKVAAQLNEFSIAEDLPGLRLRGNADNLAIPLSRGTLGQTIPANFSLTSDLVSDTKTWQATVFLGYEFDVTRSIKSIFEKKRESLSNKTNKSATNSDEKWSVKLQPYLQFERRVTSGTSSGPRDEVNKVGVGSRFDLAFGIPLPDYMNGRIDNAISARPLFLTDSVGETRISQVELVYTPTINLFGKDVKSGSDGRSQNVPHWTDQIPFNRGRPYRELGIGARFNADARLRLGRVHDDGGKPTLQETNDYTRLGTKLEFLMYGLPGTLFDRFQIFANYQYFRGFTGQLFNYTRVETGLNYTFPRLRNFGVGFRYVKGRENVTLEDVEFWEATLNARF